MSKGSKTAREIYLNQYNYNPIKTARNTLHHRQSTTYIQQITNNRTASRTDDTRNQSKNSTFLDRTQQDSPYLKPNKKENIQPDLKNNEIKYLMRIAALEKENQKINDQIDKYRRSNAELRQYDSYQSEISQLAQSIKVQKAENHILKKTMSNFSNSSSCMKNLSTKTNTLTQSSTLTHSGQRTKQVYIPSYMAALNLVQ